MVKFNKKEYIQSIKSLHPADQADSIENLNLKDHQEILGYLYVGTEVGNKKKIPNLEIDDFVSYLWAFLKFKAAMNAIDVKTISEIRDDKPSGAPW